MSSSGPYSSGTRGRPSNGLRHRTWRTEASPSAFGSAQLCLLDPKLNGRNKERGNSAFPELNEAAKSGGYFETIKDCTQFVGLENTAEPKSGALGYFSAALRENYHDMMVQQKERRTNLRPKLQSFSIYEIQDAKKHYDPKTGMIGPCGCNDYVCKAHDAIWFFCKF